MKNEMTKIEFKPISEVVGWFAVSSGKIWSDKSNRLLKGRVLKESGYVQVGTEIDGKVRQFREHRLICKAFHGEPKGDANTVNHINNNRSDNRPENLEWLSIQDNINYSVIQNRRLRKLTVDQILSIKTEWKPKDRSCSTRVLARKYGVHHSYINAICRCKFNKHIKL